MKTKMKKIVYATLTVVLSVFSTFAEEATAAFPCWNEKVASFSSLTNDFGLKVYELTGAAKDVALESGIYYVPTNMTFTGEASTSNAEPGGNGLRIATNAVVYIYIPEGVTLTATGGEGLSCGDATSAESGISAAHGLKAVEKVLDGIRYIDYERENGTHRQPGEHYATAATGGGAGILVPTNSCLIVYGGLNRGRRRGHRLEWRARILED